MRKLLSVALGMGFMLCGTASLAADDAKQGEKSVSSVHGFKLTSLDDKALDLSKYKGKALLIVNTASQCGYTPQYKGLQALYEKYGKDGLCILGVPANEFGAQEPGSNSEIATFCEKNYGVKFDMASKQVVKGDGITPLFKFLTSKELNDKFGGDIKWNFTKFLISPEGTVVGRYEPKVKPESEELGKAIEAVLPKK